MLDKMIKEVGRILFIAVVEGSNPKCIKAVELLLDNLKSLDKLPQLDNSKKRLYGTILFDACCLELAHTEKIS